jgi:hypothetical protein
MAAPTISAKSFLRAMTLPDEQRRKVLESLGAKMMDQFRAEREMLARRAATGKLAAKGA